MSAIRIYVKTKRDTLRECSARSPIRYNIMVFFGHRLELTTPPHSQLSDQHSVRVVARDGPITASHPPFFFPVCQLAFVTYRTAEVSQVPGYLCRTHYPASLCAVQFSTPLWCRERHATLGGEARHGYCSKRLMIHPVKHMIHHTRADR